MRFKHFTTDLADIALDLTEKYRSQLHKTLLRTGIKLTLSIIAIVLIVCSKGATWSLWVAACIFDFVLIWAFINFISTVKKAFWVMACIISEWSISEGILFYITANSLSASLGIGLYSGIRKTAKFLSFGSIDLPKPKEVVKDFIGFALKESLLFIIVFYLFVMFVRYGCGNTLMHRYTEMTLLQICCMPLRPLAHFIPGL